MDTVVRKIASTTFTGEIGDGKIFVHPVADVIRVYVADGGGSAEWVQEAAMRVPEYHVPGHDCPGTQGDHVFFMSPHPVAGELRRPGSMRSEWRAACRTSRRA